MATTSSKLRSHHHNLSRSNSLRTSKVNADASHLKPLPNYLKPTISSRGEPVRPLSKPNIAHALHASQKLLRRRSFDLPPSASSSPRLQKSLDISPLRPRDTPSLPREKTLTAPRSSSFHATRSNPSTTKSPPVAPKGSKKSSLSTSSSNTNSVSKKAPDTDTSQESPRHEVMEVVKVATTKVQEEDKEDPAAEAVHPYQPTEEKETKETDASPALDSPFVTKAEEAANDDKKSSAEDENREEQKADEAKEEAETAPEEDNQNDKAPEAGDISTDVATDMKLVTSVRESTTEQEKEGGKEIKEEESSDSKEEASKTTTIAVSPDGPKRQVVQGKESPSAYNDVIEKTASKLLENQKNKVKALVGAFETVIDYETAASK